MHPAPDCPIFVIVPLKLWVPEKKIGKIMLRIFALAVVIGLTLSGSGSADAATATQTFSVQITLTQQCIFSTATGTLNFGTWGVLSAAQANTTTLNVQCTNTTPYNIGLDAGIGTGATVAVRKMTNGAATVNYSLYSDAGHSTVWGNTVGTDTVSGTGNGSVQTVTVYGQVPAQATPAAGVYTDTITATITY